MIRPSDWLTPVEANRLYKESVLEKLEACHIRYRDGMLFSRILTGTPQAPYPTLGRIASVPLISPREAVSQGATLHPDMEDQLVYGYQLGAALWRLLHPITVDGPPSLWTEDIEAKLRRDTASLRSYGY